MGGEVEKFTFNAYGPLFNLLALPACIATLLPKVIFCLTHALCAVVMLRHAERLEAEGVATRHWRPWVVVGFFWSPFFWSEIAWCGHFDILVAALCMSAVWLACRERQVTSGICLGGGCYLSTTRSSSCPSCLHSRGGTAGGSPWPRWG